MRANIAPKSIVPVPGYRRSSTVPRQAASRTSPTEQRPSVLRFLAFEQQLYNLGHYSACALIEFARGQIRYWMRHRQKTEFMQAPRARHRAPRGSEDIGDDGSRGNALLFEYYAVEHTARAARPSIPDTGNDHIALSFEL